jgi:hypothetical protein
MIHTQAMVSEVKGGWRSHPWAAVVLLAVLGGALACGDKSPTKPSTPGLTATIAGCTYFLATDGLPASVPASGGTFTLDLTTAATCAWTTSGPSRIGVHMTSEVLPAQGVGSGAIQVTVRPHTGIQKRNIQATVATMTVGTIQSAAPPPVAGPNAILLYSGTGGESLSGDQAGVATTDQYDVPFTYVNGLSTYRISLQIKNRANNSDRFRITMEAANGQPLTVGRYENPQTWPGGNQPHPVNGLSVSIGAFGCSFQGEFEIFDIAFDASDRLLRLHGRVLQRCSADPPGASLTMEIWYPSKGSF